MPSHWQHLVNAPAAGTRVSALTDLPDGAPTMFSFAAVGSPTTDSNPFLLLVLRSGDDVFGYVNRCAHFGVPLAAKVDQLIYTPHVSISCNVHYARYRWRDGVCEFGDCEGETLLPVPLEICAGDVRIAACSQPP